MENPRSDELGMLNNVNRRRLGVHPQEIEGDWSDVGTIIYDHGTRDYSQTSTATSYRPLLGSARENGTTEGTRSRTRIDPHGQLYAHLQRRHVGMISIGGAIGTGLFLRSGGALADGGPWGALLAYATFGTVVYCLTASISEMSAAFPELGGPVGLADRFVDPALGFATGWNAWYHWSITIPAQIAAATALVNYWEPPKRLAPLWPAIFLIVVIGINLGGARRYGEIEFVFSVIKILTVIALVIIGIAIDFGAGDGGFIGFKHWQNPGSFAQYMRIEGVGGRFLGFWAVFMHAAYSYFGCEITGIVASEIKNAHWAVPRASRNTFVRLTVLYLSAIFVAGLLVPHNDCRISSERPCTGPPLLDDAPWRGSPFIIALEMAGAKFNLVKHVFIACFVTSAVSAASAETFISSRYLYYLAKSGHAPGILGSVYPPDRRDGDRKGASVPWVGLVFTVLFSLLSFMSIRPGTNKPLRPEQALDWMASMTTAASLQSWIGMLFTYIRFYRGTEHPPNKAKFGREIAWIRINRAKGQPGLAIYAILVCSFILIFHGWSLFRQPILDGKKWVVYELPGEDVFPRKQVAIFVTTYLPLPLFLLLVFGYKLINQSQMVSVDDMNFKDGCGIRNATEPPNDPDGREIKPQTWYGKLWWFLVS